MLWRRLLAEWKIDDAGSVAILRTGLESFDRAQDARRAIEKDGLTILDRWDIPKVNPAAAILRDAEAAFRSALRQLGIDKATDSPPRPGPGRPGSMV